MDMTSIFTPEDMIYAAVWKLICESDKYNIPRENRHAYVIQKVDMELNKWL
jgi:hypothetical protein